MHLESSDDTGRYKKLISDAIQALDSDPAYEPHHKTRRSSSTRASSQQTSIEGTSRGGKLGHFFSATPPPARKPGVMMDHSSGHVVVPLPRTPSPPADMLDEKLSELREKYGDRFAVLKPILLDYYANRPNYDTIRTNISLCHLYLTSKKRLAKRLKPALDMFEELEHVTHVLETLTNLDPDEFISEEAEVKMRECWQYWHDCYFSHLEEIYPKLQGKGGEERTVFLQQLEICYETLRAMPRPSLPNWERVVRMGRFAQSVCLAKRALLRDEDEKRDKVERESPVKKGSRSKRRKKN